MLPLALYLYAALYHLALVSIYSCSLFIVTYPVVTLLKVESYQTVFLMFIIILWAQWPVHNSGMKDICNNQILVVMEESPGERFYSEKDNIVFIILFSVCGGELSAPYGSINSPGYPGNYPPDRDCFWTVTVQPGLLITFAFGTLKLEDHPNCSYDFLEVIHK